MINGAVCGREAHEFDIIRKRLLSSHNESGPEKGPRTVAPSSEPPSLLRILRKRRDAEPESGALVPQKLSSYSAVSGDGPELQRQSMGEAESFDLRASGEREIADSSRSSSEMPYSLFDSVMMAGERSSSCYLRNSNGCSSTSFCASSSPYLPTRSSVGGASLIERISRGRIGTRRYVANKCVEETSLFQQKARSFSSPKIVRARAKCMLRRPAGGPKPPTKQRPETPTRKSQPLGRFGSTDLSRVKGEDVERIFHLRQFRRRVAPDILLDNYRKRSRSPAGELREKETKPTIKAWNQHTFSAATRAHCATPVRVTQRLDTKELRKNADVQLLGRVDSESKRACFT